MCIQNSPDEESQKTYWCWNCDKAIPAKDYAVHDRLNHDLEQEGEP